MNINGKLIFGLCMKCCQNESKQICRCTVQERQFLGVWCTPEIEFALAKCHYRLIKVCQAIMCHLLFLLIKVLFYLAIFSCTNAICTTIVSPSFANSTPNWPGSNCMQKAGQSIAIPRRLSWNTSINLTVTCPV